MLYWDSSDTAPFNPCHQVFPAKLDINTHILYS